MGAKILVFIICVEAIIYFLLHNFHDSIFSNVEEYPCQNLLFADAERQYHAKVYYIFSSILL